jgi:hypothetical protein
MGTGRLTTVIDTHEHHTPVAVRETDDRIHQMIVAKRRVTFSEEFSGELFATCEKTANVRVGEHDGS